MKLVHLSWLLHAWFIYLCSPLKELPLLLITTSIIFISLIYLKKELVHGLFFVLFFSYVFYFNSVQDLYKQENSFVHVYASKCSKGTLTYLLIQSSQCWCNVMLWQNCSAKPKTNCWNGIPTLSFIFHIILIYVFK